jgi:hypothetical protein
MLPGFFVEETHPEVRSSNFRQTGKTQTRIVSTPNPLMGAKVP